MAENIYKILYWKNVLDKLNTFSETRKELIKEYLQEQEIYLANFPEIYQVYDWKNQMRKFSFKINKNDWYVFLYKVYPNKQTILIAEFFHFLEDYYDFERDD